MSNKVIDDILAKCESTGLFLGEAPLKVNDTNIFGDTPLHLGCRWDDAEAVKALLSAGANVNATGDRGQTPLFCVESVRVVDLLLAAGADPTIKDDDGRPAEKYLMNVGLTEIADHVGARSKRP